MGRPKKVGKAKAAVKKPTVAAAVGKPKRKSETKASYAEVDGSSGDELEVFSSGDERMDDTPPPSSKGRGRSAAKGKSPASAKKGKKGAAAAKSPAARKASAVSVSEKEESEAEESPEPAEASPDRSRSSSAKGGPVKNGGGKRKGRGSKTAAAAAKKPKTVESASEEEDDDKEYEVDRILEVQFLKGGKREFLIKWKGYSPNDATWEPEENLSCTDLVEAFMAKVDKNKERVPRETRVERKQTQRYFDSNRNAGVRSSRRNSNKPRTTYHGQED